MSIIAHITADVKIKSDNLTPISDKWSQHKAESVTIARKMRRAGMDKRSEDVMACGNIIKYTLCKDCGRYQVERASLCHDRLCPTCTWRRAIRRCATLQGAFDYLLSGEVTAHFYFLTLTVPNCYPSDLSNCIAAMSKGWAKLRRRVSMEKVTGWARSLEVTYNARTHTVHPHYHVILMCDTPLSTSEQNCIINDWCGMMDSTKREAQNIQHITPQEADTEDTRRFVKAILEAFKYTQKYSDLDAMPVAEFRQYADQIAGKRAVAYGGAIKDAISYIGLSEDDTEDEPEPVTLCYACKSASLLHLIARWSLSDSMYKVIDTY